MNSPKSRDEQPTLALKGGVRDIAASVNRFAAPASGFCPVVSRTSIPPKRGAGTWRRDAAVNTRRGRREAAIHLVVVFMVFGSKGGSQVKPNTA